ncbi:MAG: hypothetical protein AAFR96_10900 [Planctomycetota bacterium]
MPPLRRCLEIVHAAAAALWFGVAVATAAAAAIIFPTVRDLDPTLATYPDYTGEHWRLAAGHIAAKLFAFGDVVGFICLMLAGFSLTIIAATRHAWASAPKVTFARLASLGTAVLAAGYNLFILGPRMNGNLQDYWAAAAAGNNAEALTAQQAFMADHAPASNTLAAIAIAALALVVTSALALTASPAKATKPAPAKPTSPLETPELATKR